MTPYTWAMISRRWAVGAAAALLVGCGPTQGQPPVSTPSPSASPSPTPTPSPSPSPTATPVPDDLATDVAGHLHRGLAAGATVDVALASAIAASGHDAGVFGAFGRRC